MNFSDQELAIIHGSLLTWQQLMEKYKSKYDHSQYFHDSVKLVNDLVLKIENHDPELKECASKAIEMAKYGLSADEICKDFDNE